MVVTIKKVTRIAVYSTLLGIVSLFGSLFLKNKREYHITINPLLNDAVPPADADVPNTTEESGDGGSGCGSSSDM